MKFFTIALSALLATATANPVAPSTPEKAPLLKGAPKPACPANLPPKYISPSLIVPISAKHPNTAYGSSYSPKITPGDFCTIFNLYIPPWASGKTCTLEFLFPKRNQLETSSFSYSGGGHFTFTGFAEGTGATAKTTWNTQPEGEVLPTAPDVLTPGHAYTIHQGSCPLVKGQYLEVSGSICSNDTSFEYFQDYNPCPIGLYTTVS